MGEQLLCGEVAGMAAFEDRSGDVGSEIGEPHHPGEVGACQTLVLSDLGQMVAVAVDQFVTK